MSFINEPFVKKTFLDIENFNIFSVQNSKKKIFLKKWAFKILIAKRFFIQSEKKLSWQISLSKFWQIFCDLLQVCRNRQKNTWTMFLAIQKFDTVQ